MSRRSISSVSSFRFAASIAVSTGALATSLLGCGAPASLLGGECGNGFAQCDYACVDLANDPDNCGACGNMCAAGTACVASTCTGSSVASSSGGVLGNGGDGASGVMLDDSGVSTVGQPDAGGARDGGTNAPDSGRSPSDDSGAPPDAAVASDGAHVSGDAQSGSDAGAGSDAQPDAWAPASDDASFNDGQAATTGDDGGSNGSDAAPSDDASGLVTSPGDDASSAAPPAADAAVQCIPPFDTAQQCGDCFTACSGVNEACLPTGLGGFACALSCAGPLAECNGQCVDERTDPNNCGTCGKICPSNLCGSSLCEGVTPGDVIVLGHDYATTLPGTAQARALSNAVFLPSSNPVRILSFEQYADPGSVANAKAILVAAAAAEGKSIRLTVSVNGADIPSSLDIGAYDTLIVYDQAEAPPGALGSLGTSWAATVATYLGAGGNVVTLDGAAGTTAEMPALESNAGFLAVTSHTPILAGTPLTVVASGDSVALGVLSPYGAATSSAHFLPLLQTGETSTYVVVEPVSGEPVVVHRTVSGKN